MRKLSFVVGLIALTALGCNDPTSRLPTTPSPPGVASLELSGPASIAPGQSAQLVATIRLSDGTGKAPSLDTHLQWFSSNSQMLQVSSTGLATAGQQLGDARITVIIGSGNSQRSATKEFVVVPNGTYRMVGIVTEADFPAVPVFGARVEVSPGSLVATTDFEGRYRLYGVPADANVQVTKAGYSPLTLNVRLTAHATQNFQLTVSGTRLNFSGSYTLTIDTAGSCSSTRPLSQALQRRSYDAVLTQNGPEIAVALTEARFRTNSIGRGNGFTGRAGTEGATFVLSQFDSYYYPYYGPSFYPSVAERLADGTYLVPNGTAVTVTTGSAAGLSGPLNGAIYNWDSRFPFNSNVLSFCVSPGGRFTLTPR